MRLALSLALALPALPALAQQDQILLSDSFRDGVHYTTVDRGPIREVIYTSPDAIDAAQAGDPFPEGTQITMEMYQGDDLARIFVMEKRASWEDLSQAGSWLFRGFDAAGNPDLSDDGTACQACHAPQSHNDYVFTRGDMAR